jgi:dihydroorotate dehydrogenase subfamily 1
MGLLDASFLGLKLKSPVMAGSAGITANLERMKRAEDAGAGAVIMKGISDREVMRTSPAPRFCLINHKIGVKDTHTLYSYEQASEWGPHEYAEEVRRAKECLDIPIIANVACNSEETWAEYIDIIQDAGIDAFEINVSCPHGSITFSGEEVEKRILDSVKVVRETSKRPVILKLSPQLTQPLHMVEAAAKMNIEAVTLFNRLTGLEIDIEKEIPIMHGGYAGHGGPWAIQYALRWVSAVSGSIPIEISASGGVTEYADVVKYILAGANTVQVCSAIYINGYEVITALNKGLTEFMEAKDYASIDDFRGKIRDRVKGMDQIERRHFVQASIDFKGVAPCKAACPLEQEAPGYISLIAEGKYEQALRLIKMDNPFPGICGRACHHPCEAECLRGQIDEPISIANLKRFVVDNVSEFTLKEQHPLLHQEKIAVIGSGPAGLSAAYYLSQQGYKVTVFEAESVLGGMMRIGIPAYRLPRNIVQKEIDSILNQSNIDMVLNCRVGRDVSFQQIRENFSAVIVAVGAHKPKYMGIPGETYLGVTSGIEFLRQVNLQEKVIIGKNVAVIGGGNVAVDAARSAVRLGAEVVMIFYRRTREEMPADPYEIDAALEEGIELCASRVPIRIVGDNDRVKAMKVCKTTQSVDVTKNRAVPTLVPGTEELISVDTVIICTGQEADCDFVMEGERCESGSCALMSEKGTGFTQMSTVFVCGDAATGPATLVDAIAGGKRVAKSIHEYLQEGTKESTLAAQHRVVDRDEVLRQNRKLPRTNRQKPERLAPELRTLSFDEVNLGFSEEVAQAEAKRCMSCSGCVGCGECERICLYSGISRGTECMTVNDNCDGCAMCTYVCRNEALSMKPICEKGV